MALAEPDDVRRRGTISLDPRPSSGIVIREVKPSEAVPLLIESGPARATQGMSRAMPRFFGSDADVAAFVAERGVSSSPIAAVWGACEPGRASVTVHHVRLEGVPDAVMARLFAGLRDVVAHHGVRWLRWRLGPEDLPLLSAIRTACGVPVLHREGSEVVAEVAVVNTRECGCVKRSRSRQCGGAKRVEGWRAP